MGEQGLTPATEAYVASGAPVPDEWLVDLAIPLATVQRVEQDACILTMAGPFLDCSGVTLTRLIKEASLDKGMSEGT